MANTIQGTGNDDILDGTSAADIIYGDLGNDTLNGNEGDDSLFGNDGDDTLNGGIGADALRGGNGNDTLNGEDDDDEIYGGAGDDIIRGGLGADLIKGHSGADDIHGDAGDDNIDAGSGDDVVQGGDGNDTLLGSTGHDTLSGDAGDDNISGGGGNDVITGGEGADTLLGDAGNDTIDGGAGVDTIEAGSGEDIVTGGAGADIIDGGKGHDTIHAGDGDDEIVGDSGNDTIFGEAGDDNIKGNAGQDVIEGGDGNDFISGGGANDTLSGGAGNDKIYGGQGDDVINGGEGNDRLIGDTGSDTITGGAGDDVVKTGKDDDVAVYVVADNAGATDSYDGGLGVDTLRLEMTAAEYAAAQQELVDYQAFLAANADENNDAGASFTFSSFGLTATDFEVLEVYVDGELTPVTGNNAPDAVDDTAAGTENDVITGNVLANDVDPDAGDTITVVSSDATSALGAAVTVAADGSYTYTPGTVHDALAAGETVVDTFSYTIEDQDGASDTATVSLTITGTNDEPVVSDTSGSITENDVDATGAMSITDVDTGEAAFQPATIAGTYGSLALAADGSWTYTLDNANATVDALLPADAPLEDVITVTTADGTEVPMTISINGFDDPLAISGDDTGSIAENTLSISGTLTATDPDGADGFAATVYAGNYGLLVIDASGNWTYQLDNNNSDVNALQDGDTLSDTISVTTAQGTTTPIAITITGTNDGPVVDPASDVDGNVTELAEDVSPQTVTLADTGLIGFGDGEGENVTVSAVFNGTPGDEVGTFLAEKDPADTTMVRWTFNVDNELDAVQQLGEGETLNQSWTLTFTDASGAQTQQTVNVTITGTNDTPTISAAVDAHVYAEDPTPNDTVDELDAAEDGNPVPVSLNATDVDANDTLSIEDFTVTSGDGGGITVSGTNAMVDYDYYSYLGNGDTEVVAVSYKVSDGTSSSNVQAGTITIHGQDNAAEFSGADTGEVWEDADGGATPPETDTVTGTLIATDVDEDDQISGSEPATAITAQNDASTTYGEFSIDANGAWTYTVDNNNAATQALAEGETAVDTIEVITHDGTTHNINITVHGSNDAASVGGTTAGVVYEDANPAAAPSENSIASGTLTSADVDNLDNQFIVQSGVVGDYGTFSIDANGDWQYVIDETKADPLNSNTPSDVFTVSTVDGTTQNITITVHGKDDAAVITVPNSPLTYEEGDAGTSESVTIELADQVQVVDPDDTAVTISNASVSLASGPTGYTVPSLSGSEVSFDKKDYDGLDDGESLTYTVAFDVQSGGGTPQSQTLDIVITGTNDGPVFSSGDNSGDVVEDAGGVPLTSYLSDAGTMTLSDAEDDAVTAVINAQWVSGTDQNGDPLAAPLGNMVAQAGSNANEVDWSFTVLNGDVQYLDDGESVTQIWNVTVQDAAGTQSQVPVTVTIDGAEDAAEFSVAGSTAELGETDLSVSATVTATDVDISDGDGFLSGTLAGTYGDLEINEAGEWTYTRHTNANGDLADDLNSLADGETHSESFTVQSKGGTNHDIVITINGENDAAVISGDVTGSVVEQPGLGSSVAATGTVTAVDVDGSDNTFQSETISGTYGELMIGANGNWTYTLDETAADPLNDGDAPTETFTVKSEDGTEQDVVVTVNGANDPANLAVAGTVLSGAVTEDSANTTASGTALSEDVDNADNKFQADSVSGTYGDFSIDADGNWSYALDATKVDPLTAGQTETETFIIRSEDGTPAQVSIAVNGADDDGVVAGDVTGTVVEHLAPEVSDTVTTGTVTYDDPEDAVDNTFVVQTSVSGQYGAFTIEANGDWNYHLDNTNATVDALNAGESLTDTFTVVTADGVSQDIVITINGVTEPDATSATMTEDEATVASSNVDFISGAAGPYTGVYGSLTVTSATGEWTYTIDTTVADTTDDGVDDPDYQRDIQGMQEGDSILDTIDVNGTDVTITITGENDAPEVTTGGDIAPGVAEDTNPINGALFDSGSFDFSDKDIGDNVTVSYEFDSTASGRATPLGTFLAAKQGDGSVVWTYTVQNDEAEVQALNNGDALVQYWTVTLDDGREQTTQQMTVTITGTDDDATITGDLTGSIDEDAAAAISGDLDVSDGSSFTAGTTTSNYGTLVINAAGEWTYTLNPTGSYADDVQALNVGDTIVDSFQINTSGTAAETLNITITGSDDAPVISTTGASVDENGAGADPEVIDLTSLITVDDVDNSGFTISVTGQSNNGADGEPDLVVSGNNVSLNKADFDHLAAGESVVYTVNVDVTSGSVTESKTVTVTVTGANDAVEVVADTSDTALAVSEGDAPATQVHNGEINVTDPDGNATAVTAVAGQAPAPDGGVVYGSASMTAQVVNGVVQWAYQISDADIDHLNGGDTETQTWNVTITDSDGLQTVQPVVVTITGTNDDASITVSTISGSVTEEDGSTGTTDSATASGDVGSVVDVDDGEAVFQAGTQQGTYGALEVQSDGTWQYTLDNDASGLADLNGNGELDPNGAYTTSGTSDTFAETFTVASADGTATETVTVTVTGSDVVKTGSTTDDVFTGESGSDHLVGNDGADVLSGLGGADRLEGGDGNDELDGGAGDDYLFGGTDDDEITGGAGEDHLEGGDGVDRFIFADGDASGAGDVITDFNDGGDVIDLIAVGLGGFSDLTVTDDGTDVVITYNDGSADQTITLDNASGATITADDFLFT